MLKTEPRLQYDMVKLYAYYNTRINLPLWTKMQVVDPNTGKAVMVEKEIENGKLKIENEPSAENNNKPEVELVPLKVRIVSNILENLDLVRPRRVIRGALRNELVADRKRALGMLVRPPERVVNSDAPRVIVIVANDENGVPVPLRHRLRRHVIEG